jgi:hypothetical protein
VASSPLKKMKAPNQDPNTQPHLLHVEVFSRGPASKTNIYLQMFPKNYLLKTIAGKKDKVKATKLIPSLSFSKTLTEQT